MSTFEGLDPRVFRLRSRTLKENPPALLISSVADRKSILQQMSLVPDWAPNIHPMFVHFPIGLLFTAVFLDLLSLIPALKAIRRAVTILYVAGAVAAIATYFTGRAAADHVSMPADAESILTEHADLALWTVLFFATYALIRIGIDRVSTGARLSVRLPLVIIALAGIYLVWETAEHGSEMVYAHGVGVRDASIEQHVDEHHALEHPPVAALDALTQEENAWTFVPASAGAFRNPEIQWIEGSPSAVSIQPVDGGVLFRADSGATMFVIEQELENVQVFAELAVDQFDGSVMLVHHVEDGGTFDFLELAAGTMSLGRSTQGELQRIDSAALTDTGWVQVRTAGDGTHFRGYVGDEMLVHGHQSALPAGRVGLRLDGQGEIRLRLLRARSL